MSKTVAQIYATNPTTVVADTDLYYLVQSPYTPGADAAITGASLKAAFGSGGTINPGAINSLAYYAAAGSTLSALATLANGTLITSAGGVPSISQTLPTTVQGNITSLGTIASGVWNGSIITGTYGGTGVNNGASTITLGGSLTTSGAFASTFTMTGVTAVTFPTTGTLATTSQLPTPSALTKTDDTNVTLTLGGSPTVALLAATSLTLGWTGLLAGTRGGTGVNNGASTITIGGNFSMVGAFTFAGTLTGNTAVTFPTSGTLATTASLLTSPLTTKGDIWVWSTTNDRLPVAPGDGKILQVSSGAATGLAYSTPTYPSASGTNGLFILSNGTNNVYSTSTIPTSAGATANKHLISDGTNYVLSTPTFPNSATSTGTILRADGTNWVATTSTYPNTNAINTLLYASAANVMSALATANNGLLVTGPTTGTPSILAGPGTTGNMLISNAAAAPSFTTFAYPTTVGATGSIHISNGTNIVSSTSLWPNTVGTSGKVVISDGTSNVYSTPTFPNASATLNKIIKSDGTNWIASTETYAAPGTSGNVMTSNGTNWTSAAPATGGTVTSVATAGLATGGPITTTGTVTVTAAVQADMETGTSTTTAVVPGVMQYHPGVAKAWAMITNPGGSPPTISANYNVSSIVRNSTGNYTLTLTTGFSSSNYAVVVSSGSTAVAFSKVTITNGTTFVVIMANTGGSAADDAFNFVCFGDQ